MTLLLCIEKVTKRTLVLFRNNNAVPRRTHKKCNFLFQSLKKSCDRTSLYLDLLHIHKIYIYTYIYVGRVAQSV